MVLAYWGIKRDQIKLAKQMKIIPGVGTPSFRIRLLASRRLRVIYGPGKLADLRYALSQGIPPIAMVYTGELPYWRIATAHAVVLLAIDENFVFLNVPDKEQGPIRVTLGDFELAWYKMDNKYALLKKQSLWQSFLPKGWQADS